MKFHTTGFTQTPTTMLILTHTEKPPGLFIVKPIIKRTLRCWARLGGKLKKHPAIRRNTLSKNTPSKNTSPAVVRYRILLCLNIFGFYYSFKRFLSFASLFTNPVRLGNRTYRAWGLKIWLKNRKLNSPVKTADFSLTRFEK